MSNEGLAEMGSKFTVPSIQEYHETTPPHPPGANANASPAIALRLQSTRPMGQVAEPGALSRMKAEGQVLKVRPGVSVVLTRDSVCAGDDCDAPHEKTVEVFSFVDPEAFARAISSEYLPSVAGVGHSWTCMLNGVRMAEITADGIRSLVREILFSGNNRVHFVYHSSTF